MANAQKRYYINITLAHCVKSKMFKNKIAIFSWTIIYNNKGRAFGEFIGKLSGALESSLIGKLSKSSPVLAGEWKAGELSSNFRKVWRTAF